MKIIMISLLILPLIGIYYSIKEMIQNHKEYIKDLNNDKNE